MEQRRGMKGMPTTPFIGVGRWWWGGEMAGQAAVIRYQERTGYGRGGEGIDAE
jgi:hypothetical protein